MENKESEEDDTQKTQEVQQVENKCSVCNQVLQWDGFLLRFVCHCDIIMS